MDIEDNDSPTLDVRSVPFSRRLSLILSTIGQLAPGDAIDLVVEIDPWPLRQYFESMRTPAVKWTGIESGPEIWRIRLSRR